MRKILIVDDEKIERNGLKLLLGKSNRNVEILEANNGKVAYQILANKNQHIDILLTDIKMPFMSGLELAKEARSMHPELQIAIFSGYGEFEFAREAIQYGVTDYILKPVNPVEFQHTIERMLKACDEQEQKQVEVRDSQEFFLKYLMMNYLYTGNSEYMDRMMRDTEYGEFQNCISNIQSMMLLDIDNQFFEEKIEDLMEMLQDKLHRKIGFISLNSHQLLLFFSRSANNNYVRIANLIVQMIRDRYAQRCYIAVSRWIDQASQCPQIYQELEVQMDNKFYHEDVAVFPYNDCSIDGDHGELQSDYLKGLKESIHLKDVMHVWDNFHKIQNKMQDDSGYSHMYTKFIFSELVKDLYEEINGANSVQMIEKIESIYRANNLKSVILIVEAAIQEFEKSCMQTEQSVRRDIDQVKQYIFYHVEEDLSVEKLASKVYLSQGHLSYIFKKETGMNLSRYIKECRMEAAKKLLLETNMKIVQISEKVGFSNVSYFCQSFREYCGISPEKYRKGEGEEDS